MPSPSSTTIIQKQIDAKADEKWAIARFTAVEKDEAETRAIALSAKKKAEEAHECTQSGAITEIRQAMFKGRNLKIGVVVAIFLALGTMTASHYSVKNQTENNTKTVGTFKAEVDKLQETLKPVSEYVKIKMKEEAPDKKAEEQQAQVDMLVKALQQVEKEKAEAKPPRSGRRRPQ